MIINTGGRTDTVQYYTEWLLNRFSEGYVLSRNPLFPNKVTRYELTPDTVDCVVFCSKNYKPILPRLHEITDRFHTYFHYTITAYGKDIEPGVPGIEESMETLIKLAGLVGKQRIAWRYDPVLLTKEYTVQRHIETFEKMAKVLSPYLDRNGILFKDLKHKGTRQGCHCIESRDIGAYDTCMNGCKYCYANKNPQKAFENYKYHDKTSPLLLGVIKPDDTLIQGAQKTFQKVKRYD